MNKFSIAGTKRSGHHAVLIWLAHQLKGRTLHYNTCLLPDFLRGRVVRDGKNKEEVFSYGQGKVSNTIYSFEYYAFNEILPVSSCLLMHTDQSRSCILVLRDLYNMVASSIESAKEKDLTDIMKKRVSIWKDHAKNFDKYKDWTFVKYNDWATSKQYRKKISENLGLHFSDKGKKILSRFGGGSSFDKFKYDGNTDKMDVLNRWKTYIDNPFFLKLVDHNDLAQLNKMIFGFDLIELRTKVKG